MVPVLVTLYMLWVISFIALALVWVGFLVAERNPTTLLGAEPELQELLFHTPKVIGVLPTTAVVVACFFWPILLLIAFVFFLSTFTVQLWRSYRS